VKLAVAIAIFTAAVAAFGFAVYSLVAARL
jgi:hypothetical protein